MDRNDSEYFLYRREPNRIYVKFHSYILDNSNELKFYEGRHTILELVKTLNPKGVHEKYLMENINSLLKGNIISNRNFPISIDDKDEMIQSKRPHSEDSFSYESRIAEEDLIQDYTITFNHLIEKLEEMEENYTSYLTMKNMQWTSAEERENFVANLKLSRTPAEFKEIIKYLQEKFVFIEVCPEKESEKKQN